MNYQMLRDIAAARRGAFTFLGLIAVVTLGLFLYLALFQKPELAETRSRWSEQREAIASGKRVGNAALYQDGMRDLELFRERLVDKKEFPRFLEDLFDMAGKHSLELRGVSYRPPAAKGKESIPFYGIGFTVSGTYPEVKAFIAELARYPQMVTVDGVSLNSPSQTEERVDLKVQLTAFLKMEGA